MPAETLNCPMCGASAASDSSRCEHCGARLATVSCPSCFGLMFLGAKFCSHCGAQAQRAEISSDTVQACPRCRTAMSAVRIGKVSLRECPRCEGLWADTASLEQICADREEQALVLGAAATVSSPGAVDLEKNIRYLPCPICRGLMNRVNFAHCSAVIVDVCAKHGTWFDKDELRRIVEFIRSGGLERARDREIEELERKRRQLSQAQAAAQWENRTMAVQPDHDLLGMGLTAAAVVLKSLLR